VQIDKFTKPGDHPLASDIKELIYAKWRTAPRSLQVELGPSEIGEPCPRKLAQKVMREPAINEGDPLPSIVGTAAHAWMEAAIAEANQRLGRQRFIPEMEIEIIPGIPGHCDCFDVDTGTVIDWKFSGQTKMTDVKKNGPGQQYRVQAHLYGKGYKRLGYDVREVAIVFFPRGGMLSGMHIWSEPFDESIADAALERYYQIIELCDKLEVEKYPERYQLIPMVMGHSCTFCDYFLPGPDTGKGCPGWTKEEDLPNAA